MYPWIIYSIRYNLFMIFCVRTIFIVINLFFVSEGLKMTSKFQNINPFFPSLCKYIMKLNISLLYAIMCAKKTRIDRYYFLV